MYVGGPTKIQNHDVYNTDSTNFLQGTKENQPTLDKTSEAFSSKVTLIETNTNQQAINSVRMSSAVLDIAEIPLIDIDNMAEKTEVERQRIILQFGVGLREIGFVAIKAPASMITLIDRVNSIMKEYFSQDIEVKKKDIHGNNGQTGFSRQGNETAAGAKKADLKETYFIPPNFERWPEFEGDTQNKEEFKNVMDTYHKAMTFIAAQLMGFVAEYLNEPTEDVSKSMGSATNLVRAAFYPAPKPTDDPEAVWAAAHEDLNALTLLPPSTIPGLQLLTKDGKWKSVIVPQGFIIVNTGEQLQMKTAGMIQATRHQVINPGGEYAYSARYASIFFASWSDSYSLKPFDSCSSKMTANMSEGVQKEYSKKFPDVTVKDNLISRLIEMNSIPNPPEGLVSDLLSKGLLRNPSENLVKMYAHLFKGN